MYFFNDRCCFCFSQCEIQWKGMTFYDYYSNIYDMIHHCSTFSPCMQLVVVSPTQSCETNVRLDYNVMCFRQLVLSIVRGSNCREVWQLMKLLSFSLTANIARVDMLPAGLKGDRLYTYIRRRCTGSRRVRRRTVTNGVAFIFANGFVRRTLKKIGLKFSFPKDLFCSIITQ